MIQIEINEESALMIVNAPALMLLTEEEYSYLENLGKSLSSRWAKEVKKHEQV